MLATAATPTPAGNAAARSSLAAERRRLVRSVPAGARSGVASVFDAVAKNLRHNRTPLFGLNAQFRAYATESPQSGSTKPKQPQDAQEARDAKEQEQKKFEEEEKRLQEQKAKLMDEGTALTAIFSCVSLLLVGSAAVCISFSGPDRCHST